MTVESVKLVRISDERYFKITFRDLVAVLFRRRRALLLSFFLIFLAVGLWGGLRPKYRAEMKLMVRRGRVDPIVTSQQTSPAQIVQEEISETEINSEVELLNSHDVLRKVVLASGFTPARDSWLSRIKPVSDEVAIEKATNQLAAHLQIEPVRKTNLISVGLESSDPRWAARVLNSLAAVYLEKHLEVHRSNGEFTFFDKQTEELRRGLTSTESKLTDLSKTNGVISAQVQLGLTLHKASELEASLTQTEAAILETERRIQTLVDQSKQIPARSLAQLRTADNPGLLQEMKSTLLQLELKRIELLTRFEPSYPSVVELEKQISDTRAAIAQEKDAPIRDETTDRNATYEWLNSELAKARTDLSGLEARKAASLASLAKYQTSASELQQASFIQEDLLRTAKTQEDNYLLYSRKGEEARINDALDRRGILNVAVADPPSVPLIPVQSPLHYGVLGLVLACIGSVGVSVCF